MSCNKEFEDAANTWSALIITPEIRLKEDLKKKRITQAQYDETMKLREDVKTKFITKAYPDLVECIVKAYTDKRLAVFGHPAWASKGLSEN